MPPNNNSFESRASRRERLGREQGQESSRAGYYKSINRINDSAVQYVFAKRDMEVTRKSRQDFRNSNLDEAEATIYQKSGFTFLQLALLAVVVIDYLIVGGTLDYLLGMQRELQGHENYFFILKLLATTVLLLIEVSIAIGLAWMRENLKSKLSVFLHWLGSFGIALTLTFFAGSLMYQKIHNEAIQSAISAPVATDTPTLIEDEVNVVPEIPTQKWLMLAGVCGLCFLVHIFAVMKADTVSEAVAWTGFAIQDARYAGHIRLQQSVADREAGRVEASYRGAYDQFEMHNAKFLNDQLPSVPSQPDPNQLIPVMRLNPVAQRIIENLQNGTIENLDRAQAGQNNVTADPPFISETDITGGGVDNDPISANQQADYVNRNGFNDNHNNEDTVFGDIDNNFNLNENGDHAGNNTNNDDAGKPDLNRNIVEAQIRNSESEI